MIGPRSHLDPDGGCNVRNARRACLREVEQDRLRVLRINFNRPILIGAKLGGQLALKRWKQGVSDAFRARIAQCFDSAGLFFA